MKGRLITLVRVVLSLGIAAFLALSPRWLAANSAVDHYRAFYEKPAPDWYGVVELWHIVGFRTYQGSVTDFLQARANKYCDSHPGVHIKVTGMSLARYEELLARGLLPDGYSFPAGLLYREQLQPIAPETPVYAANLQNAVAEGETYAVPYLLSAYVVMTNAQLAPEAGPGTAGAPDAASLAAALHADEGESQLSMPPVLAAEAGFAGAPAAYERFSAGKLAYAVADLRALGDIERRTKEQLLVSAAPYAGFCDLVQYLGAARGTDARRAAILSDFFAFLLSQEEQALLPSLGALPVIRDVPDAQYAARILTACFESRDALRVPDALAYQQQRDALESDALRALANEPGGADSFYERLSVVMGG